MPLLKGGQAICPTGPVCSQAGPHCASKAQTAETQRQAGHVLGQPSMPTKSCKPFHILASCCSAKGWAKSGWTTRKQKLAREAAQETNNNHTIWRSGTAWIRSNRTSCEVKPSQQTAWPNSVPKIFALLLRRQSRVTSPHDGVVILNSCRSSECFSTTGRHAISVQKTILIKKPLSHGLRLYVCQAPNVFVCVCHQMRLLSPQCNGARFSRLLLFVSFARFFKHSKLEFLSKEHSCLNTHSCLNANFL